MRKILICTLLLSVVWACNTPETKQDNESKSESIAETNEFETLFDGKTSKGWRGINSHRFPEMGWQIKNGSLIVNATDGAESGNGRGNHYQNFIDCIRANDNNLNNAPIEGGFYSCALIHLANISYRLGRILDFDPAAMKFIGDEQANAMLTKEYRKNFEVPDKV